MSSEKKSAPSTLHADSVSQRQPEDNTSATNYSRSLLNSFLNAINAVGSDAQEKYEKALTNMRERPEEVIIEIARAEERCDVLDYPKRWALIEAASELKHAAALSFLSNLVLTPIPPERSENPHSFSTVAEETLLRTTAVDGVRYLAEQGSEEAIKRLYEFLGQPSLSIRRASVQAILSVNKDNASKEHIASLLPPDQRFLIDLKTLHVGDVPQIDNPQAHLSDYGKREEKKKQPLLEGTRESETEKNQPGPRTR
jgi:hypothetical protein